MKTHIPCSKSTHYPVVALSVSAIALSAITFVAVYFKFDGVIQIKLGMDGGQVLIDGRQHIDKNQ